MMGFWEERQPLDPLTEHPVQGTEPCYAGYVWAAGTQEESGNDCEGREQMSWLWGTCSWLVLFGILTTDMDRDCYYDPDKVAL